MQVPAIVDSWEWNSAKTPSYAACHGSKPKTRIQLREMRADFCTCALLGKKAAPGWTSTPPHACPSGWIRHMQLITKWLKNKKKNKKKRKEKKRKKLFFFHT